MDIPKMKMEDFVGHYSNTMANPDALETKQLANRNAEELTSALSSLQFEMTLHPGEEKTITVNSIMCTTSDYYLRNKKEYNDALAIANNPEKAEKDFVILPNPKDKKHIASLLQWANANNF